MQNILDLILTSLALASLLFVISHSYDKGREMDELFGALSKSNVKSKAREDERTEVYKVFLFLGRVIK